ncbi:hypothetical protein FRC09_019486 [Ceratobasidium sp. 395]|nr:hypothetical protein FRC09_019486 [Ceratobasidium sp. 395]
MASSTSQRKSGGLRIYVVPEPRHVSTGFKRFETNSEVADDLGEYLFWIRLDDLGATPPNNNDSFNYPDQGLGFVWLEDCPWPGRFPGHELMLTYLQLGWQNTNRWVPLYASDKEDAIELCETLRDFLHKWSDNNQVVSYKEFSENLAGLVDGRREEDMSEKINPSSTKLDERDAILILAVPDEQKNFQITCELYVMPLKMHECLSLIQKYAGDKPDARFNLYLLKDGEKLDKVMDRKCKALEMMLGFEVQLKWPDFPNLLNPQPQSQNNVRPRYRYMSSDTGMGSLEYFIDGFDGDMDKAKLLMDVNFS